MTPLCIRVLSSVMCCGALYCNTMYPHFEALPCYDRLQTQLQEQQNYVLEWAIPLPLQASLSSLDEEVSGAVNGIFGSIEDASGLVSGAFDDVVAQVSKRKASFAQSSEKLWTARIRD